MGVRLAINFADMSAILSFEFSEVLSLFEFDEESNYSSLLRHCYAFGPHHVEKQIST